jgi:hypothetical protein
LGLTAGLPNRQPGYFRSCRYPAEVCATNGQALALSKAILILTLLFAFMALFSELLRALALLPLGAATPTALPITITNAVTGVPIPYASLGIKNKPIGL